MSFSAGTRSPWRCPRSTVNAVAMVSMLGGYFSRVHSRSIVPRVSVPTTLLGLLEPEASHGYELKREYDQLFSHNGRPLSFGQLYTTLSRLERDGQIVVDGAEPGEGPERKRYAITPT